MKQRRPKPGFPGDSGFLKTRGLFRPGRIFGLPAFSVLLALAALFSSCTIRQSLVLEAGGGGTSSTDIRLKPFFRDNLENFTSLTQEKAFSAEKWQKELSSNKALSDVRVKELDSSHYTIGFRWKDLNALSGEIPKKEADKLKNTRIFSLTKQSSVRTLELLLNKKTLKQLDGLFRLSEDPLFSVYGPEANEGMNENELLETLSYSFGDRYRPDIKASDLILDIKVPAAILSYEGGQKIDARTIRYRIPLLRIMLLNKPIHYKLRYK